MSTYNFIRACKSGLIRHKYAVSSVALVINYKFVNVTCADDETIDTLTLPHSRKPHFQLGDEKRNKNLKSFIEFCKERSTDEHDNSLFLTAHNTALFDILWKSVSVVGARKNSIRTDIEASIQKVNPTSLVYSPKGNGKSFVMEEFVNYASSEAQHAEPGASKVIPVYISCRDLIHSDRSVLEAVAGKLQKDPAHKLQIDYDPNQHWNVFKHIGKAITNALAAEDKYLFLVVDDIELLYQVRDKVDGETQTERHTGYKALLKTLVNFSWLISQAGARTGYLWNESTRIIVILAGSGCSGSVPLLVSNMADPTQYPGQLIKVQKDSIGVHGLPAQPLTSFRGFQSVINATMGVGGDCTGDNVYEVHIDPTLLPLFRLVSFYNGCTPGHLVTALNGATADNTITPAVVEGMQQAQQQRIAQSLGELYDRHFAAYLLYMELTDMLRAKNARLLQGLCDYEQLELAKSSRSTKAFKGDELRGAVIAPAKVMATAWEASFQPLSYSEIQRAWGTTCSRYLFLQQTKQLPSNTELSGTKAKAQKKVVMNATDYIMCKQILSTLCDVDLLFTTPVEFGSLYEKKCYPVCMYQLLV